jgi:hypothetical protein
VSRDPDSTEIAVRQADTRARLAQAWEAECSGLHLNRKIVTTDLGKAQYDDGDVVRPPAQLRSFD